MNEILHDLYRHQAWADAEHWHALEQMAGGLEDPAIRQRLHHIHLVQRAYLSLLRGERVRPATLESFTTTGDLKSYARESHAMAEKYLAALTNERASSLMTIPWFRNPPIQVTVGQAMVQAAMHSHYHRGQNATRMRELGGTPPLTDFIVWLWKERPAPTWE